MEQSLFFDGKEYVSSKRASEISKYTKDYVGQLCRGGKIEARLVGRNWYVNLESLRGHMDDGSSRPKESSQDFLKKELNENTKISKPSKPSLFVSHFKSKHIENSKKDQQRAWHKMDQNREKENILTHMDVAYEEGSPMFFEDDSPLYPGLVKSKNNFVESQIDETKSTELKQEHNSDKTIFFKADLVDTSTSPRSVPSPIKIRTQGHTNYQKRKVVIDSVVPTRRHEHRSQTASVGERAPKTRVSRKTKPHLAGYGLMLVFVGLALLAGSLFAAFQDMSSINYTAQVEPAVQ